jgi:hypothetical protein
MRNPRNFAHIRAHSLGGAVHDGDHDSGDDIAHDDPRYFSPRARPPRPGRKRGGAVECDADGYPIYSQE